MDIVFCFINHFFINFNIKNECFAVSIVTGSIKNIIHTKHISEKLFFVEITMTSNSVTVLNDGHFVITLCYTCYTL